MISCKCESTLALDRVNSLIWAYNIRVNLSSKNATFVDWTIIANEWWNITNHTEMVFSSKGCVLLRVYICSKGNRSAYLAAPPTDKYLRMCEQRHTNTTTLLVLWNLLEMVRVRITCISFLCKHETTLIKIDCISDYIHAKQIKNAMLFVLFL